MLSRVTQQETSARRNPEASLRHAPALLASNLVSAVIIVVAAGVIVQIYPAGLNQCPLFRVTRRAILERVDNTESRQTRGQLPEENVPLSHFRIPCSRYP